MSNQLINGQQVAVHTVSSELIKHQNVPHRWSEDSYLNYLKASA